MKERVPCGPGASCTNLPGWFKCSCPMTLVGDAYGLTGCRSPLPVCFHDADCKNEQKCNPVTQECYGMLCPNLILNQILIISQLKWQSIYWQLFDGMIFLLFIDICSKPGVCGKGAICKAVNSRAECYCPAGHRGNPYVECSIRKSIFFYY